MPKSFYFADRLIDGTGIPAKRDVLICAENGSILSVDNANPVELRSAGLAVEAFPDCTVLPGLIDSHVHLTMSGRIDRELRSRQLLNEFEQNVPLIHERI
jgi:imidazolonepropionase-like amidohydrolase